MKEVILDTSFVITALKEKIDFFDEIESMGIDVVVPQQTLDELKALGSNLGLAVLKKHKFKLIKISGENADAAIINYSRENPNVIIASLDKALQKKTKRHRMVIRARKKIEVI